MTSQGPLSADTVALHEGIHSISSSVSQGAQEDQKRCGSTVRVTLLLFSAGALKWNREPPLSLCSSFSPYLARAVSVCKYMLKITLRAIEQSAFYELLSGVVAE